MRIIKARGPLAKRSKISASSKRQAWDDFGKKPSNKKVFEKTEDDRYLPVNEQKTPITQEIIGKVTKVRTDYEILEKKIDYKFNDKSLLVRALTHRSALQNVEKMDYERLEFLGDAVLALTVAHLLSDIHMDAKEGLLSKMRSALVNTKALADLASNLELGEFIRLGRSELSSGIQQKPSILSDVMEALIGAIYRDSGYEKVLEVVHNLYGPLLSDVHLSDPKTELQEILSLEGSEAPIYQIDLAEGPIHSPTFVAIAIVDGEIAGKGKGGTKKAAHQEAAKEALIRLKPSIKQIQLKEGQDVLIPQALHVQKVIITESDSK